MNCYNKWKTSTLYTGKNEHLCPSLLASDDSTYFPWYGA